MAQVVWTALEGDAWAGTLGDDTVWFKVAPVGFRDYFSVTTSFPLPADQATSYHGAQAAKDASQAAVDKFTALLSLLAATPEA